MTQHYKGWVLFLSIVVLLTGCEDKKELEQHAYVIAIGLDKAEKENKVNVTFQIANAEGSSKDNGGKEKAEETVTITADNFIIAQNMANSFVTREISLDHTKVLIVSEELARTEQFLSIVQAISRTKAIRRGVQMIVTKEKASDFLNNNNPTTETRPHKYYQFMIGRGRETGIIPDADIHRFFQITEGDAGLYLAMYATSEVKESDSGGGEDEYLAGAIPQQGGNTTQFMGSAVFKEGKMIGTLTGEETRICLILDKTLEMQDVLATYPDPKSEEHKITTRFIMKNEPSIKIIYQKEVPTQINVKVPIDLEILAVPSLIDYSKNKESMELLSSSIEDTINQKVETFIKRTQEEFGTDPFYWSLYIRHYFLTIKEYEEADWNKKIYPNANISVKAEVEIVKFGKTVKETKFDELKD